MKNLFSVVSLFLILVVSSVHAGTVGMTGTWKFVSTEDFGIWTPDSLAYPYAGAVTAVFDFDTGSITTSSSGIFFGFNWNLHDGSISDNSDGTYDGSLLFDWSSTINKPLNFLWEITDHGNGTATVMTLDGDADGYPGITITDGIFAGSYPILNGTLTAVPVPTAVWLFASGLIGLTGIARRTKKLV